MYSNSPTAGPADESLTTEARTDMSEPSGPSPSSPDGDDHAAGGDRLMEVADGPRTDGTDTLPASGFCPLFSDGLPANFQAQPALLALASLAEGNDEDADAHLKRNNGRRKIAKASAGGRQGKKMSPYRSYQAGQMRRQAKEQRHQKMKAAETSATLGEAQMFLSMWRI
mmetsp:Transcript_13431/g.29242  ORF Transcript_13431/g.29242 Transcript_13431/m.29242 type:complete len:169 (-) Transcript_13431:195-701(-)